MEKQPQEVVLVGAGIMSATLSILLKKINPAIKISVFEKLDKIGFESSDAFNNAGTGHSAFCELNYTPMDKNGVVNIDKAINITIDKAINITIDKAIELFSILLNFK